MNIYDHANELADAIKKSTEYIDYKRLSKEIENDSDLKIMIDDYHNRQLELQKEQLLNNKISKESENEFNELIAIMKENPKVHEFLNVEMRFAQIMADVSKIISEL
ncbi:MAG: YlbF family regulator [Bacillota bacterium]|nr:YlbF family regulator [Bacillota bacterium]